MTKRAYGHLEFRFKTPKAAFQCYRFLSLGVELGLLPKIEFQLNDKNLVIGWWQPK